MASKTMISQCQIERPPMRPHPREQGAAPG
jgi:hypothetical protein